MKPVGGSPAPQAPMPAFDLDKKSAMQTGNSMPMSDSKAKGVPPDVSKKAQEAISQDTTAMLKRAQLQAPKEDLKAMVTKAQASKADGTEGISKSEYESIKKAYNNGLQTGESTKWLEKEHPQLHAAIVSDLDYNGYVGVMNGSLNKTRMGGELKSDAAQREQKLDKLPGWRDFDANGLPKSAQHDQGLGNTENGSPVNGYKTGSNYTKIVGDDLGKISDDEATKSRNAQKDFTVKMSALTGSDVSNPPSVKAARAYFQTMADRGATSDQIKSEYGQYLKTFYRHPGGGVDWKPALDPKNLDSHFSQQPVAKDGKRIVDCEGFSALTENVLGGLKKNGQPMFDIQHGASDRHVVCGVFPHGQDPSKGFVVDNASVTDIKLDPRLQKDYDASPGGETRMRFLVRQHMKSHPEEGSPTDYGDTYTKMHPPTGKVPK